jgi:hypothetical protein
MARPKFPEEMTPLGFRLPNQLIDRLDAYCDKHAEPGRVMSRSDAIRVLLEKGLAAEGLPHAVDAAKAKAKAKR